MSDIDLPSEEHVTLGEARALIRCLAREQSILLLSPPGIGKSDTVYQAAAGEGLACRSLLGTQIAPEDVSGIPRIVGERSVFCPPRVLLPEDSTPFCLFLDELPASAPDVQKALYSLLLERRLGEHRLPEGSWVVAAGNRAQDRALVRAMSSALVNRVAILNVRVDYKEWLGWARSAGVRSEILAFINFMPDALMRPVPAEPLPFSTPRAWAALSRSLDLTEAAGMLSAQTRRALAFGRLTVHDATLFCAMADAAFENLHPIADYVRHPALLPKTDSQRWFLINQLRNAVTRWDADLFHPTTVDRFLLALPEEHRFALLVDRVPAWGSLGANDALLTSLKEVTGL